MSVVRLMLYDDQEYSTCFGRAFYRANKDNYKASHALNRQSFFVHAEIHHMHQYTPTHSLPKSFDHTVTYMNKYSSTNRMDQVVYLFKPSRFHLMYLIRFVFMSNLKMFSHPY